MDNVNFGDLFKNIARWFWSLLNGVGELLTFLFSPISETIQNVSLPNWVITALEWIQGIIGTDVAPIMLIGVTGIILAIVVGVVKTFV